ncbi:protein shisa-5 isoform X2 [Drosophila miranda]|uniref:protein shisa-5 isoform X2 n=1 Tax=Drosophila miranda TaxID=7229 RepID=UPI0007E632D1|nr:protein shisa-5 isoform X2 [Drosophila miranda]
MNFFIFVPWDDDIVAINVAYIGAFVLFLVLLICASCCCCVKKSKKRRQKTDSPVVVTSATHTAPGGYPVTQLPPPGYPAGNAYAAPYPAQTTGNVTVQMPMPMQQQHQQMPMPLPGMQTHGVAYPPYSGAGAANMNPPTYDMAVASPGPSVMPAGYEKQSPYNPNFGQ